MTQFYSSWGAIRPWAPFWSNHSNVSHKFSFTLNAATLLRQIAIELSVRQT